MAPNKNVIKSKSFKHKTSVTGSTNYNVPERIRNSAGRAIDNPNYNANKKCKKN